jgi:hypothetical protein
VEWSGCPSYYPRTDSRIKESVDMGMAESPFEQVSKLEVLD